jgi:hypothetical protein
MKNTGCVLLTAHGLCAQPPHGKLDLTRRKRPAQMLNDSSYHVTSLCFSVSQVQAAEAVVAALTLPNPEPRVKARKAGR